jgi:uncharacterized protein
LQNLLRQSLPDLARSDAEALQLGLAHSEDPEAFAALLLRALSPLEALRLQRPGDLFAADQASRLAALQATVSVDVREFSVTGIVKVTRQCNLRCTYCHDWRTGADAAMTFETRLQAMHWLIAGSRARNVRVLLHGGEPTLIGERGLLQLLAIQAHLRVSGQRINNHVQSNGTHLPAALLRVLRQFDISVSVSLDGPSPVHDATRRDARGRPTSERVLDGLQRLQALQLLSGVVIVASNELLRFGAVALVRFLRDEGLGRVAILAMRPGASDVDQPRSTPDRSLLDTRAYLGFLEEIDKARRRLAPWLEVRELDALLRARRGEAAGTCELQGHCVGRYFGIEPGGQIMHCDKYVGDSRYVLGHVREPYDAVANGRCARELAMRVEERHRRMQGCRWHRQCRGWCPHEDYVQQQTGTAAPACCGLAPWFEAPNALEAVHAE